MHPKHPSRRLALGVSLLLFADVASADMGVPMIFLTLPAMLVALLPIVLVESLVLGRMLGSGFVARVKSVAAANVASTLLGLPITWVVLVALQMTTGGGSAYGINTPARKLLAVTWQAPWLVPYETDLYWMLPAASLVLLIPFFFASYFVEAPIVARMESAYSRSAVRSAVFRANIVSYALLAIFTVCWLLWSLHVAP